MSCVHEPINGGNHVAFQYCNMVHTQEWIHEETQAIAATNFRFSSKGSPMKYVLRLAGYMQVLDLCCERLWLCAFALGFVVEALVSIKANRQ